MQQEMRKNHIMSLRKAILYFILFLFCVHTIGQNKDLHSELESYVKQKNAVIGLAFYNFQSGTCFTLNNDYRFPMQSVYKFHLALTVLKEVDKGRFSLDENIFVSKADLLPDTWSPMRDAYPGGNIEIPLSRVIQYAVAESDNNACDILFKLIGGQQKVNRYVRKTGAKGTVVVSTEAQMHADWDEQFRNYSSPHAALKILKKFYNGKLLKQQSYDFLWETMSQTSTGPGRIKGLLPLDVTVAHKTGTGGVGPDGKISAVNDIGIIKTYDDHAIAVVFFISQSDLSYEENDRIISDLSLMIFNAFHGDQK